MPMIDPDDLRIVSMADCCLGERLDALLRPLLRVCFDNARFERQRFCHETPARRYLIDLDSMIAAHLAVHEKLLHTDQGARSFIGIAEVCVAPDYRGRGLVGALLAAAEREYAHLDHALLLGDIEVYGSSGYRPVEGVRWPDTSDEHDVGALLGKHLSARQWPAGGSRIHGPPF